MKHQEIFLEAKSLLIELAESISQLTYDDYNQEIELLGNSTIGQHTRHIIELFQQLSFSYEKGQLNYDDRKRNPKIQQNIDVATERIAQIISELEKPNKALALTSLYNEQENKIESNYIRELIYNIEHCVHHQAILKIGLKCIDKNTTDESFGVAKSTLLYKKQCAQ